MKSFIFAIILIAAVIAVTVTVSAITDEYTDRMISAVEDAVSASAGNRSYEVRNISTLWEEAKTTVCVSVHRKEVTRTETLITALAELCERSHTDTEFFGICRQLEEELRHIKELGIPSWRNIM